jgi:hypothetical protein
MAPQTPASAAVDSVKAAGDRASASASPIEETVIQVDDKLYSAEKLASFHPGGERYLTNSYYDELQRQSDVLSL